MKSRMSTARNDTTEPITEDVLVAVNAGYGLVTGKAAPGDVLVAFGAKGYIISQPGAAVGAEIVEPDEVVEEVRRLLDGRTPKPPS